MLPFAALGACGMNANMILNLLVRIVQTNCNTVVPKVVGATRLLICLIRAKAVKLEMRFIKLRVFSRVAGRDLLSHCLRRIR